MSEFIDTNVVAVLECGKYPLPVRFQIEGNDGPNMVSVDEVVALGVIKSKTDPIYLYQCKSDVGDRRLTYELGFRPKVNRWHFREVPASSGG